MHYSKYKFADFLFEIFLIAFYSTLIAFYSALLITFYSTLIVTDIVIVIWTIFYE